jgi:hypothetical protein
LQAIWQNQRLLRDQLTTLDGAPARVLHPGFRNVAGGPDFRGAIVQFGEQAPVSGDVEVDIRAGGWHAHGHDCNPAFRGVVLHVLWDGEPSAPGPPALALRPVLDAPLGELNLWLGDQAAPPLAEEWMGRCREPLRELEPAKLLQLLHEAAHIRLQSKAALLQARARQAGWEQSFWEGVFRALGYKHNTWPMQRLGELRPRWQTAQSGALAMQARLLGISGLLPVELNRTRGASDKYLRDLWDRWWRERDEFADCVLPRAAWRFHGLRPANHPQRRFALAAQWAETGGLCAKLGEWCVRKLPDAELAPSLLEIFQVEPDPFWSWHYTIASARLKKSQPLLGLGRVTDLAINVVLPWLWVRAGEGKNARLQEAVERRYFAWPAAEDNSVLRHARLRLLGGATARSLPGAAAQQGLMQLVRDFCEHSNTLCEECKLPELAGQWCHSRI